MELLKTASAFGFHSYDKPAPDGRAFGLFSKAASALFEHLRITPTYIGIEGEGYSGDYKKHGGPVHKKLVNSGFGGITVLSIVANPDGSDAPSYDSYATISYSYVDSTQESLLCFVINESLVQFGSNAYDVAWNTFLSMNTWDFGYGFASEVEKQPEFHILGLDNGKLTAAEQTALYAWYGCSPSERLDRLRGIYAYNFISTRQLDYHVFQGMTLREFIMKSQLGDIRLITDYGLSLWRLNNAEAEQARGQLRGTPALISM